MNHKLLLPTAVITLGSSLFAQAVNLDIGQANGCPSLGHGGAAGQTGLWNRMTGSGICALKDNRGAPTSVQVSSSVQHNFNFASNNPLTWGDDELLLDAGHDGALTLNFTGLAPGEYLVHTYAWAPDNISYFTDVYVSGSLDSPQSVGGGTWTGAHVLGETYALHRKTVTDGTLQIVCTVGNLYATVNGVQLEPSQSVISYCTAKVNSLGCMPAITSTGSPSANAGSGFVVSSLNNRNHRSGVLFYGVSGRASSAFQGGTLCVQAPVRRTLALNSGGAPYPIEDCSGVYSLDMNAFASGSLGGTPLSALSVAGTLVHCQFWGRDPGYTAPNNTSLSDGLEYVVQN